MSEVVCEVAGVDADRVAVVSGPNLAREIALRQPTATVVAATTRTVADRVAAACSTDYFRPYTNTDVVGVEIAGAMKNVIALAVGMAVGLGWGTTPRPRSSPAGWPRRPGWVRPGRGPADLRRAGRAWATWSPPAPRR